MKQRLQNIQTLRGVAALGVLLFHISGSLVAHHGLSIFEPFLRYGEYGVDLFFALSGLIMVLVMREEKNQAMDIARFLYSRFSRIYPTYWFYVILVGLTMTIAPGMFARSDIALWESILLLPHRSQAIVVVGWTLVYEVYFYLVFGLLLLVCKDKMPFFLTGWAVLLLLGNLLTSGFQNTLPAAASVAIYPFSLEFIGGCLAGLLLTSRREMIPRVGICSAIVFLVVISGQFAENSTTACWRRMLFAGVPTVLVLYLLVRVELKYRFRLGGIVGFVGDFSYSLYLSHIYVLAVFARLSHALLGQNTSVFFPYLYAVVALIAALLVAVGSYYLVERPLMLFFRKRTFPSRGELIQATDVHGAGRSR